MAESLRIAANIASVLTSLIAMAASITYWLNKRSKRIRLEKYLEAKRQTSPTEAFSVTRLMADLGMTEAEIFAASFASRHVVRGIRRDGVTGFAAEVLFQYRGTGESLPPDEIVYRDGLRRLEGRLNPERDSGLDRNSA